jgi:hypothetical protein
MLEFNLIIILINYRQQNKIQNIYNLVVFAIIKLLSYAMF